MKHEKDTTYIATISGGKDSVTMCDLLCKNGYPVDYILFADTLQEFSEMYEYIEKLKVYFKDRHNKEIIVLKPKSTFEDWAFGTLKNGEGKGNVRGLPLVTIPCWWRRESKVKPQDEFIKQFDDDITFYIGFTKDEDRSIKNTDKIAYTYPLKDIFNMTENDCKQYLINQEMENPLYRHFSRTGCAMCPYQSEHAKFNLWKYYPDTWEYMKKIESKLSGSMNDYWFVGRKTCVDMEKKFKQADKQGSLFNFSDDPLKDCFCKI